YISAATALSELAGPLIAGAATTVAALFPLFVIENSDAGTIAGAIAIVTITSLVIGFFLLPPLLLWRTNANQSLQNKNKSEALARSVVIISTARRKILRSLCRLLSFNVKFCVRHPFVIIGVCLALTASAILVLFVKGADTSGYGSEDSLYAQVEFDGGLLAEEADRRLRGYSEQLAGKAGIRNVETGARTGSGSLLISFNPKQTKAHLVREQAKQIPLPGGFVFFPENSARDRYWEIKIYGEEDEKCRELAEELAFLCAGHPLVRDRVLNFKQGSKKMILLPDREVFAEAGIAFSKAAVNVRMGVYGPVAYKKMDLNGETDVRIFTGSGDFLNYGSGNVKRKTREEILGILVSALPVDLLMQAKEQIEPSSIRRDNRRRTASITITTKPMDARRVKQELHELFENFDLPPGYSVEFDPDAIRQAQALSSTIFSLVLAVLFCYMIIAAINESLVVPLVVLAAIPPSLAIPALCLAASGSAYNLAIACAFIAVSGMTVNASVLCVDSIRSTKRAENKKETSSIYFSLRKKMPALLATTGTTIAGAIPFLFLKEGANMLIKTLSLVGALGVTCSCLCSITVIPSLYIVLKKSLEKNQSRLCGI
ncbi:MAG: efflux RND transporter permease subunit, partial [Treponema sp.]|nr:efflux RND transporter permease subunit [Treponema sp.]